LNKTLLDTLETMSNVKIFFNHKLTGADFKRNLAWIERRDPEAPSIGGPEKRAPEIEVSFDFMIGADGAHSPVRYHLMKFARVSYQQTYIDTLWCEFHIPPSRNGDFKLSPNHLHIWPAKDAMFIAIPSSDKSFTSTLFLTASAFAKLDSDPDLLLPFFRSEFPGVVSELIAEADLRQQYSENAHLPLISVKCTPYHYKSSVVILGDAAHAMVPFYGQGMNAGFEDVRVLFEILDRHQSHLAEGGAPKAARGRALEEYTQYRGPDATTINDLALRNYQEMRSDVHSLLYRTRKWLEETASVYLPSLGWATQYSRISFGNERYSDVVKETQRQSWILMTSAALVLASGCGLGALLMRRWLQSGQIRQMSSIFLEIPRHGVGMMVSTIRR
jgi:kynurenine 3-monooxygenase